MEVAALILSIVVSGMGETVSQRRDETRVTAEQMAWKSSELRRQWERG